MDTNQGWVPLSRGNHSNLPTHNIPPRGEPLVILSATATARKTARTTTTTIKTIKSIQTERITPEGISVQPVYYNPSDAAAAATI